jgi:hypothetical protein
MTRVLALGFLGLVLAVAVGLGIHVLTRETIALPVVRLEQGASLAPAAARAPQAPPITTRTGTTTGTTNGATTTTGSTDERADEDNSGPGSNNSGQGRGRGRGGDD